jgi:DNA primase
VSTEEVRDVAKQFLDNVKASGPENIQATCPFHAIGDRVTTTFSMSLARGVWFCFSCHEKGNLQSFLKKMGVGRAVVEHKYRYLIDELERSRPLPPDPLRMRIFSRDPLPEALLGIFDYCPLALVNEGFTEETLQAFDVGYDETHHRITFPLRDLHGQLVGFSGRTIYKEVQPRYKIYDYEYEQWNLAKHETPRSAILWNAHNVYPEIFFTSNPKVALVEGFKACMWVVQAGFQNTVALLGSFLTDEHQWILERMGAEVYVFLDNDPAGWKGREYIGKALSKTLKVNIVEYDEEIHQPDGMSQEAVLQALSGAKEFHRWTMERKEGNRWDNSEKTWVI